MAIVLGLANVVADGFSMAVSNFLKSRADLQVVERFRAMEEIHIDEVPDAEREEIRQIFSGKGFDGEILKKIMTGIETFLVGGLAASSAYASGTLFRGLVGT